MNNIVEYNIPKETFIGGYIMPDNIMNDMINYFETNKQRANPGTSYNTKEGLKINNDVKESLDYFVSAESDHWPIYDYRMCLQECLKMGFK